MLAIKLIRANPDAVTRHLAVRGVDSSETIQRMLEEDQSRRELQHQLDELRAEVKRSSTAPPGSSGRARVRSIKPKMRILERDIRSAQMAMRELNLTLPNLPAAAVLEGGDSGTAREVRTWGDPSSALGDPRPHWELGPALGLDIEAGTRMSGSRFYVLRDQLARLEIALAAFMMDRHVERFGYRAVIPPFAVGRRAMFNCGQLPKFTDGVYHAPDDDLYFIPTAESALASLHQDEILRLEQLPLRYVAWSPCFRRESGSAGQDTRGILRVHQFTKCELFWFTRPERSYDDLESLVSHAESILQDLELPYRVVLLPAGDMGFAAAMTYDLEVWLPGQKTYREISSCSNVEAFQARRAGTRYRTGAGEKPRFVHMLNGSGLAVGRTMIALLENHQREDGSVHLPALLRPYMRDADRLEPRPAAEVSTV